MKSALWVALAVMIAGCACAGSRGHSASHAVPTGDLAFRARDEALLERFATTEGRCAPRWATDTTCLTRLRELRREELQLFADVRAHTFTDITESNYWHRGRLKFPSAIEQLLRGIDGGA